METKGIIARKKTFKEKLFEKFFPEEFRRLEEAEKKIETLNYEVQDEELYTGFSTKEESKRLEEMLKKLKEREEALKAWQKRLEAKEADLEAKEEELEDVEIEKSKQDPNIIFKQAEGSAEEIVNKVLSDVIEAKKENPLIDAPDEVETAIKTDKRLAYLKNRQEKDKKDLAMKVLGSAYAYGIANKSLDTYQESLGMSLELWIKNQIDYLIEKPSKEQLAARCASGEFYDGIGDAYQSSLISENEDFDIDNIDVNSIATKVAMLRTAYRNGQYAMESFYGIDYTKVQSFIDGYMEVADTLLPVKIKDDGNLPYSRLTIECNCAGYFYGNETKMPIRFLTIGNSYGQGLEYIKGAGPKALEKSQSLEEKNPFREGENQNKYCMAFAKLVNELVPRTREEQSKDEQKQEEQER